MILQGHFVSHGSSFGNGKQSNNERGGDAAFIRQSFDHTVTKKGDSSDAMDYRPISLLQTSYKIFAKVLPFHVQIVLPRLIRASQQGFLHGRQMMKSVRMMLVQSTTSRVDTDVYASNSRCNLLLDF